MPASVRIVDPDEIPEWDHLLERFPTSTFFHSREWASILRSTYGFRSRYLLLGTAGEPLALLPLMRVDSWLTGRRGVGLPFSDECAPLSVDDDSLREVIDEARRLAARETWRYLEIRGGLGSLEGVFPSTVFHGHELPLVRDENLLFNGLDSSARRAVRKAGADGVEVAVQHSEDAMAEFLRLLAVTRKRHGVPQQPAAFFRNIFKTMICDGKGCIVIARRDRRPIAAGLFLEHKKRALYKFGGADLRFQQHRGSNLVMWKAISDYAGRGFEAFDFGRTSLGNEGLRSFKRSWGPRERTISYYRQDCRSSSWIAVADRSSNRLTPLFRNLPVPVSRVIGAMLYPHVA
ncbi:MAG: GNAT family N-acetyltransferase [Opitutaceae bacterium]|nr:GNAT family N-acetyltransferase [Opitutaceae bacterium]